MLRAISEMAVASSVRSLPDNPICDANWRPFWRASTMSLSRLIGTMISSDATAVALARWRGQQIKPFVQIEGRSNAIEGQAELNHGKGHVRLKTNHDHLGAAQPGGLRNPAQSARRKRVHHVENGQIDDDAPRSILSDLGCQLVLELHQIG